VIRTYVLSISISYFVIQIILRMNVPCQLKNEEFVVFIYADLVNFDKRERYDKIYSTHFQNDHINRNQIIVSQ
jgi:hypothetical protein